MDRQASVPPTDPVTPDSVGRISAIAALPLSDARRTHVAAVLGPWLVDANALSRKMSDPAYRALVPATVFVHANESGADE